VDQKPGQRALKIGHLTQSSSSGIYSRTCDRLDAQAAGVSPEVHPTDPDLEWLLCQIPVVARLRSTHGGIVMALEGGGCGAFDLSAAEAHSHYTRRRGWPASGGDRHVHRRGDGHDDGQGPTRAATCETDPRNDAPEGSRRAWMQ
jgi:hypothetical protein